MNGKRKIYHISFFVIQSVVFYLLIFHHQCASTLDNIEEWRRELTLFMRNEDQQEIVSRDRKDRRDFEHLSALATRMGLHRQVNLLSFLCSFFHCLLCSF